MVLAAAVAVAVAVRALVVAAAALEVEEEEVLVVEEGELGEVDGRNRHRVGQRRRVGGRVDRDGLRVVRDGREEEDDVEVVAAVAVTAAVIDGLPGPTFTCPIVLPSRGAP